jgi:ABC-type proline/glycine betaine transport system permease subunit
MAFKDFLTTPFQKKNMPMTAIVLITIAAVLGLAIGIPLSQSADRVKRAREILEQNILIDGYNYKYKMPLLS